MDPAGVAPVQDHETAFRDVRLKTRRQLVADVVQFLVGIEEERNLQPGDIGGNTAQAGSGDGDGLQLLDPDLLEHFGLVALLAARVDVELDLSAGRLLPVLAHLDEELVPDRVLRNQSAEPNYGRLCGQGHGA